MKRLISALALTASLIAPCIAPKAAIAESNWGCEVTTQLESPSAATRPIYLERYGISFDIPANYRTIDRGNGSIEILDQHAYEELMCLLDVQFPSDYSPMSISVSVSTERPDTYFIVGEVELTSDNDAAIYITDAMWTAMNITQIVNGYWVTVSSPMHDVSGEVFLRDTMAEIAASLR